MKPKQPPLYEVAMTDNLHSDLCRFLLERVPKRQEKLCFAMWQPSRAFRRQTALIGQAIWPQQDECIIDEHEGTSFSSSYLVRAIELCLQNKAGLAFMHNHLTPGWQGMSLEDVVAEKERIAPAAQTTGLPLAGLTLATDRVWSARFWLKNNSTYKRHWCQKVRVVGNQVEWHYNDTLMAPPKRKKELMRTIDTWGVQCQNTLARLHMGVVGLGSVGSLVAESLARMGVQQLSLVDGDIVKTHNLDRLLHATPKNVGLPKVHLAQQHIQQSATADHLKLNVYNKPLQNCYTEILDCDVLFLCVDKPWPKDILNNAAYAHGIPVIFGGIFIDNKKNDELAQAAWKCSVLGAGFECLRCQG